MLFITEAWSSQTSQRGRVSPTRHRFKRAPVPGSTDLTHDGVAPNPETRDRIRPNAERGPPGHCPTDPSPSQTQSHRLDGRQIPVGPVRSARSSRIPRRRSSKRYPQEPRQPARGMSRLNANCLLCCLAALSRRHGASPGPSCQGDRIALVLRFASSHAMPELSSARSIAPLGGDRSSCRRGGRRRGDHVDQDTTCSHNVTSILPCSISLKTGFVAFANAVPWTN